MEWKEVERILVGSAAYDCRSGGSSPEPDNNNSRGAGEKVGGLSADLIPDPKCGVDIRLSPTISQV